MLAIPLSDEDWSRVAPLLVEPASSRTGRPRSDPRQLLNGILWVLINGEKWHHLPSTFPAQQTCYAKWLKWKREGVMDAVLTALALDGLTTSPMTSGGTIDCGR
ncbi:transposase [Paraburkholderia sp. BCC1885]|uniref:transposase n=1 Tax=Paraburkholderia sp. BCC1885 TaxID=2562669 RepID=UPI001C919F05